MRIVSIEFREENDLSAMSLGHSWWVHKTSGNPALADNVSWNFITLSIIILKNVWESTLITNERKQRVFCTPISG